MGSHIINKQFQSDKYPWCQAGFVPLKITDKKAQPLLHKYAVLMKEIDKEFSEDLIHALNYAGYRTVDDLGYEIVSKKDESKGWIPLQSAKDWEGYEKIMMTWGYYCNKYLLYVDGTKR